MNQIKIIIAIAIIAIFAVACTDEEEFEKNKINNINQKSLNQDYDMRDHTYEIDYSDDEVFTIMQRFDSLMRDKTILFNEFVIEEALFAMEFYFNYAIVDKQKDYDTSSYSSKTFTFSIDLNSKGNINVDILKEKYTLFLNSIITSMNNKYLQYSDLYVYEKNDFQITFGLDLAPSYHNFPRQSIIKSNLDQVIPLPNDVSNWDAALTPLNTSTTYTCDEAYVNTDETIRRLSKKEVVGYLFHNINTTFPLTYQLLRTYYKVHSEISNIATSFSFSGNNLRDLLVIPTIQNLNARYINSERKPIDVHPRVWRELYPNAKIAQVIWYLSIFEYKSAKLMDVNNNHDFDHFVDDRLIFPIR